MINFEQETGSMFLKFVGECEAKTSWKKKGFWSREEEKERGNFSSKKNLAREN